MNAVIIAAENVRRSYPKGHRPTPVAHLEGILERKLTAQELVEVDAAFHMSGAELKAHAFGNAPAAPKVTRSAKAIRAEVAQAKAPARKADPVKALRGQVATTLAEGKLSELDADGKAAWWDAYKATRGMTQAELKASIQAFAKVNA